MISNKIRLQALKELESQFGVVRARDLVDQARSKKHPLHNDGFIWDDRKAADEHRLDRARQIIALVRTVVTVNSMQIKTVGYVRDPSLNGDEQGYIAVSKLRTDEDRAREALLAEAVRIQSMLERARELADALDMRAELNALLDGVINLSGRLRKGKANYDDSKMGAVAAVS